MTRSLAEQSGVELRRGDGGVSTVSLVLRDAALRCLWKWIVTAAVLGSAVWGMLAYISASQGRHDPFDMPGNWMLFVVAQWLLLGALAFAGPVVRRSGSLEMALPVTSRRLWLAHVMALVLAGFLLLLAMTVVVPFTSRLFGGWSPPAGTVPGVVVHTVAALVLFVVFVHSWRPSLHSIPTDVPYAAWVGIGTAGIVGLLRLFYGLPAAFALLPLAGAVVVAAHTLRTLTGVLLLEPSRLSSQAANVARPRRRPTASGVDSAWTEVGRREAVSRGRRAVLVWRTLFGWRWNAMAIPFLLLFGGLLGGLFVDQHGDEVMRYIHVFLTVYMLLAFGMLSVRRMYLLDPMPISRRWLFALAVLPGYLILVVGYGAGRIQTVLTDPPPALEVQAAATARAVRVAPRFLEIAWSGEVPAIVAPWGESVTPWSRSLVGESGPVVYDPYTTSAQNSSDFVDWQTRRAAEAVYGVDVVDSTRAPRGGGPVFPLTFLAVGLLWLLAFSLYARAMRAGVSEGRRKLVAVAILMVLMAAHVSQIVFFIVTESQASVWTAAVQILIRGLGAAIFGGAVTVWLASAAILTLAYLLAERAFDRVEIPMDKSKFGLLM